MAENVTIKQTTGLQQAILPSFTFGENVDMNYVERLHIAAPYCNMGHLYERLLFDNS